MRLPERVRRLVLIGPASTFHSMPQFYLHMFIPKIIYLLLPKLPGREKVMRHSLTWMHAGLPVDGVWDRLFNQILLHGSMIIQVMPRVYKPEELGRIQAETLLLIGDHERIYRPQAVIRSAQQLMPNLKVAVIPDAHHIAALAQPERVNQEIINFLS
jgi:pimeloyl-ACP methyl ester carboxylesterase